MNPLRLGPEKPWQLSHLSLASLLVGGVPALTPFLWTTQLANGVGFIRFAEGGSLSPGVGPTEA
jgi:hypothetical protein